MALQCSALLARFCGWLDFRRVGRALSDASVTDACCSPSVQERLDHAAAKTLAKRRVCVRDDDSEMPRFRRFETVQYCADDHTRDVPGDSRRELAVRLPANVIDVVRRAPGQSRTGYNLHVAL